MRPRDVLCAVTRVLMALLAACGSGSAEPDAGPEDDGGPAAMDSGRPPAGDGATTDDRVAPGAPRHGEPFTIRGEGFGARAHAAPHLWDAFEAGTNGEGVGGSSPVHGERWSSYSSGGVDPVFSDRDPRHARTRLSSLHDFEAQYGCAIGHPLAARPGDRVYLSFWWRYAPTGAQPTDNLKPWILYDDGGQDVLYVGMSVPGDGLRTGGRANAPTHWGEASQETVRDQWVRWEESIVISTPSTMDGERHANVHYSSPARIIEQWSTTAQQTHAGIDGASLDLGAYHTNDDRSPEARARILIDDVYVDHTWSRVEIGDAASFDACTRREVQLVTAWSDREITFVVNQGAFDSLAGTYVHVLGEDGGVIASQPL